MRIAFCQLAKLPPYAGVRFGDIPSGLEDKRLRGMKRGQVRSPARLVGPMFQYVVSFQEELAGFTQEIERLWLHRSRPSFLISCINVVRSRQVLARNGIA